MLLKFEAIRARGESSPKRAVKRREILDPSYVSKRRKVHKEAGKAKISISLP
jgi:hypothetical protein